MKRLRECCAFAFLSAAVLAAAVKSEIADPAMHGDHPAVRALLPQRAAVNVPQIDGTTALPWAV